MTDIFHLSTLLHRTIFDRNGGRVGRVQDMVARLGDAHPPVVGAVIRIDGRDHFVAIHEITELEQDRVTFEGRREDLRLFERRPKEILLAEDLWTRHLIDVARGQLIIAHEIELAKVAERWEVVGVDPSRRPLLRRIFGPPMGPRVRSGAIVDFASIEPFVGHVPTARLRIPYRKLTKLHPAQIADLVEHASHEEGEEIIEAVGFDREFEADVFEELNTAHRLEFLLDRSDTEAARLLARMEPDSAADLMSEIVAERRLAILQHLPEGHQAKVRNLLAYDAETAGRMMNPDFIAVPMTATVDEALDAVRVSNLPAASLEAVFVLDSEGRTAGVTSIATLLRARGDDFALAVARTNLTYACPRWDLHQVARTMSDFNLSVLSVVDEEDEHMVGVVTVDDLLNELVPQGWRREFGTWKVEE